MIKEIPRSIRFNKNEGGYSYSGMPLRFFRELGWCKKLCRSHSINTNLIDRIESLAKYQSTNIVEDKKHKNQLYASIRCQSGAQKTILHENWKLGRKKLKDRKSKFLTDKEKQSYSELGLKIEKSWSSMTKTEIDKRTNNSLSVMNMLKQCEYCDKIISNGNYHRWHGVKCKKFQ